MSEHCFLPLSVAPTKGFTTIEDATGQSVAIVRHENDAHKFVAAVNSRADLVEALTKLVGGLDYLIGGSYGVAGLHQNGETAPWGDLTRGGCCEEWLRVLDDARDTLAAVKGA